MYLGVIALLSGSYVNYKSARLTEKRETEVLGKKDTRMRRIQEMLNIKIIKFNAWEKLWEERIKNA